MLVSGTRTLSSGLGASCTASTTDVSKLRLPPNICRHIRTVPYRRRVIPSPRSKGEPILRATEIPPSFFDTASTTTTLTLLFPKRSFRPRLYLFRFILDRNLQSAKLSSMAKYLRRSFRRKKEVHFLGEYLYPICNACT